MTVPCGSALCMENRMRLGILTYALPHLKTEQVLHGLLRRGGMDIALYALPFVPRLERKVLFQHRPDQLAAAHPAVIARRFSLPYHEVPTADAIAGGDSDPPDTMLVTVGALIGPRLLERARVFNVHAGLIPAVRGLDAFKWAIHDDMPLGVSLHAIDADVDRGDHVLSLPTPVYPDDTPATLARRHYEAEIALLIGFQDALRAPASPLPGLDDRPARKRMPAETERLMLDRFPAYVDRHAVAHPLRPQM
jgi:phosphoribosylglycinamide formyltransferase 1